MNIPVFIVACIMLLVVLAHVIGGTKETAAIEPQEDGSKLVTHWVQAMCAFQMLSVDLALMAALLFAVAIWDLGAAEIWIIKISSGVFFLWGVVWVVQLLWLSRPSVTLFKLPHWAVWFLCSGLLLLGL